MEWVGVLLWTGACCALGVCVLSAPYVLECQLICNVFIVVHTCLRSLSDPIKRLPGRPVRALASTTSHRSHSALLANIPLGSLPVSFHLRVAAG